MSKRNEQKLENFRHTFDSFFATCLMPFKAVLSVHSLMTQGAFKSFTRIFSIHGSFTMLISEIHHTQP